MGLAGTGRPRALGTASRAPGSQRERLVAAIAPIIFAYNKRLPTFVAHADRIQRAAEALLSRAVLKVLEGAGGGRADGRGGQDADGDDGD